MEALGFQALSVAINVPLASIITAAVNAACEGIDVQLIIPTSFHIEDDKDDAVADPNKGKDLSMDWGAGLDDGKAAETQDDKVKGDSKAEPEESEDDKVKSPSKAEANGDGNQGAKGDDQCGSVKGDSKAKGSGKGDGKAKGDSKGDSMAKGEAKGDGKSTDSFIRQLASHLEYYVTPRLVLTSTWEDSPLKPDIYVCPTPIPTGATSLFCRRGSSSVNPPSHAAFCISHLSSAPMTGSPSSSVYIHVPARAPTSHTVYSVGYRLIAGVTTSYKELWPDAFARVRVSNSWLEPTPGVTVNHNPDAGTTALPVSTSDSGVNLLPCHVERSQACGASALAQAFVPCTPTPAPTPALASAPPPSPSSSGSDAAVPESAPPSASPAVPAAPTPTNMISISCPCRSICHDGHNRQEEGIVEYKEVFAGCDTTGTPTLTVDSCVDLLRDHIIPMMGTWPAGHLCVGVKDATRVIAPFQLSPGSTPTTFAQEVADDLDRLFQGVFPPIPRDATLRLCLVPTVQSTGLVLQFSYIFRTQQPELLRSMMHDGPNTVYSLALQPPLPHSASSGFFYLQRDHPFDLWQRARADIQSGESLSLRARSTLGYTSSLKLLLAFDETAPLTPLLEGVSNLHHLPPSAQPREAFTWMQKVDGIGQWLVIACCRSVSETQATWAALSSIPPNLHFSLLLVMTTFSAAKVAGSQKQWIIAALRGLGRDGITLVDIVRIMPPALQTQLQPLSTSPLQSASSAALQEGLDKGFFTMLPPCLDVESDVAEDNARMWLKEGALITGDVVKHNLVVCPQADDLLPSLLQCLHTASRGSNWLFTLNKSRDGFKLSDRCVGATTTLRVLSYRAMDAIAGLCVLVLHPPIPAAASELARIFDQIATSRPLLVIDDESGHHHSIVKKLAVCPPSQFVYLCVVSRAKKEAEYFQLSPMVSGHDAPNLCRQLARLYPESEPYLQRVSQVRNPNPHFLQYVLSAIHKTAVVSMSAWVKHVLTELHKQGLLTKGICSRLSGMAFLRCFETTPDTARSYAWVPREQTGLGHLLGELVRDGHGLLRRQNNKYSFFHPLFALEFLRTLISGSPDVFLEKGLVDALEVYPQDTRGDVLRRLCIDRASKDHYFSSLTLYVSHELKWDNTQLMKLFEAGLRSVERSEACLLKAYLKVVQSRYVRRWMDSSLPRTNRRDDAFQIYQVALRLANQALSDARAAQPVNPGSYGFIATTVPPIPADESQLFVFYDAIAWAHVNGWAYAEASEIFEHLYSISNPEGKKTVLQKVRAALPRTCDEIGAWLQRFEDEDDQDEDEDEDHQVEDEDDQNEDEDLREDPPAPGLAPSLRAASSRDLALDARH
eukprot:m.114267 g.114267  ORF g.114267 m.114267 type:complete len:1345 (-) comp9157_c0_seq2:133-4167(-)